MIKTVKADGKAEYEYFKKVRERSTETDRDVTAVVSGIIDNVRKNGDKAVREYTIKFVRSKKNYILLSLQEMKVLLKMKKVIIYGDH